MSTQTGLDEFDRQERPARGGISDSDPRCGVSDTFDGSECKNPAIPALGVCHKHNSGTGLRVTYSSGGGALNVRKRSTARPSHF